jgi:hypothetical protein
VSYFCNDIKKAAMRTFVELIARALDESFEKPEHNAWEGTPGYRPGPAMIPVKAHSGNSARPWSRKGKKACE